MPDKAPLPKGIVDAVIKLLTKEPKIQLPSWKTGISLILALQRFVYNAFESSNLKCVNKAN